MTIPAHITAAIRSGKFTYCGEAQLSNFGETARKGRYVEFLLDDGPDGSARHPFHGLQCGREKGQRFGLIAVPLGDDDAVAAPEPPRERKPPQNRDEMRSSQQAGIRCQDPVFQQWIWETEGKPTAWKPCAEYTVMIVYARCDIQSRKELDSNPAKAAAWDELEAKFIEDTRLPERH